MNKLSKEQVNNIELLASLDGKGINLAFSYSNTMGLGQLSSSITDFKNFLERKYGEIVFSMCGEYRIYITKLLERIEDKYKENVISELISPKVKEMTGVKFLEIIEQARKKIDKESVK